MNNQQKPIMTTIGERPTNVLSKLNSSEGVYVQCRLPNGEDVHVPLREIFELFQRERVNKILSS